MTTPLPDPVAEFNRWLDTAARETGLPNPNAMTLATVDPDGRPSARIVLLKHLDAAGAVFYSNYASRKGRALEAHPRAALVFHWDVLDRQIRIEGPVSKVTAAESDAYFASRPRESRLGAWASDQSRPLSNRALLLARVATHAARFAGRDVPRPAHWGGYRMALERLEFWQGHRHRIHDRIVYEAVDGAWRVERLYP